MQTFLPYSDFRECALVLDRTRLGKQRVETLQIMTALLEGRGWVNHPAVHMWNEYEDALMAYQYHICDVWTNGYGYNDSCWDKTLNLYTRFRGSISNIDRYRPPFWLGDERVHIGYQSNLLRKDPLYYGEVFSGIPDNLPYYWPG